MACCLWNVNVCQVMYAYRVAAQLYIAFIQSGTKTWITPDGEFPVKFGDAIFWKKGAHLIKNYYEEAVLEFNLLYNRWFYKTGDYRIPSYAKFRRGSIYCLESTNRPKSETLFWTYNQLFSAWSQSFKTFTLTGV